MQECEFSVIKYVPNAVRFEPVNIGIALLDKKNRRLHNRHITNFREFFKRLGVETIRGLEKSFENYKPVLDVDGDDHLWKLHDSFHGSVFYSEPVKIQAKSIDAALQDVFDKMISVHGTRQPAGEAASVRQTKAQIKNHVRRLSFPENSYLEKYPIDAMEIPQTRDFAFMRGEKLVNTIDVINFASNAVVDSLTLFLYEIKAIASSRKYPDNTPLVFSASRLRTQNLPTKTRQSIDLLRGDGIRIVDPAQQPGAIKKIREDVGQAAA